MADDYEASVRRWGYDAPERLARKLLDLIGDSGGVGGGGSAGGGEGGGGGDGRGGGEGRGDDSRAFFVLDCGVGGGLFGEALFRHSSR